jgi:chromosome segregation ATPase
VITHVKEKLQYLEKENEGLVARLSDLDSSLNHKREDLQSLKTERQRLRDQVGKIRDRNTNISNPLLLEDYEGLRLRKATLAQQIGELKTQHSMLSTRNRQRSARLVSVNSSRSLQPPLSAAQSLGAGGGYYGTDEE